MRRRKRYILVLLFLVIGTALIVRAFTRGPKIPNGSYLVLEVSGAYAEAPPQDIISRLLRRHAHTLIDLLTMIRTAQVDERIKGVVVKIAGLEIGWAKVQDVRDALLDFKKSNKPLLALIENEVSGGNKEYYLASSADRIYLSPQTTTPLVGLAADFVFLGGVWDKLDVQMHVEKIAEYKTFGDMLANKEMTPAHREMADSLLDSVNDQFVNGLARGRGLEATVIRALIDQCPISPAEFEAAHLSDGTKYLQDLHEELGGEQTPLVQMRDYAQVDPRSLGLNTGPKLAVVYGEGAVVSGESGTGLEGEMLGADTVNEALKDAAEDEDVRAIVFRVDSPGGSALASDLIWRGTQEARNKKPVIVSMSDVAGSGGYYISAGASRILAQPATMTGSIGVVVARPNVQGFLARLGITTETLSRGKYAQMEDVTTPLTPEATQKMIAGMEKVYEVFVDRVAGGRKMPADRVKEIARGRVWTGAQAKDNGLVDELGGFLAAIEAAKQAAGIQTTQEVELVFYPKRKGLLARLDELLGTRAELEIPPAWKQVLRSVALPFEDGAVLTLMPESVDLR